MTKVPPLLPPETFARVMRLARFDGLGVLVFAGSFAILNAVAGDIPGALVGLLIAGAGAIELHGVGLLQEGDPRGMHWLVGSQLFLLLTILVYCAVSIARIAIPPIPESMASVIDVSAAQLNMTREEYLHFVQKLIYQFVAGLSTLYQGGMALYYFRRREVVRQALSET